MSLIVTGIAATPTPADTLPRIGIDDIVRTGTLSASSEAFPVASLSDGLTYDWWRSEGAAEEWVAVERDTGATVDYMALAAHSLAGAEVTPQYHDGSDWVDLAASVSPGDSQCLMWVFAPVTATRFRLRIRNAPSAVSIGVWYCGQALAVPVGIPIGFNPPAFNETTEYTTRRSIAGNTLGGVVRASGVQASYQFRYVPESWVRSQWYQLLADIKRYPLFIAWSDKRGAGDVVFGTVTRDPGASYSTHNRLDLTLRLEGIVR